MYLGSNTWSCFLELRLDGEDCNGGCKQRFAIKIMTCLYYHRLLPYKALKMSIWVSGFLTMYWPYGQGVTMPFNTTVPTN
jgi:hypothetical protein